MRYDTYHAAVMDRSRNIYEFISVGPRGMVLKRVIFKPMANEGVFNLAFGDVDGTTVTDEVITNNGDRDKILATIAKIVDMYTMTYPERFIYLRGSTPARTRLYKMAISANIEELDKKYEIFGYVNDEVPVPFFKEGLFTAFLVMRRI